jgi:hypothetical protein
MKVTAIFSDIISMRTERLLSVKFINILVTKSIDDGDHFGCMQNVFFVFSWLSEAIFLPSKYPEGTSRLKLSLQ